MRLLSKDSAKKWGIFFTFLIACIMFNFLIKGLSELAMGGLVYLDCTGTIIAAIIGGYFPGATVALATNMLFFIRDENSIYFFIPYTILALAASDFYKVYNNKKNTSAFLFAKFVILLSLCNSIFGLAVVYFQRVENYNGHWLINSLVSFFQNRLNLDIYPASFYTFLLINICDICICSIGAYLIIRLLPEKLKMTIQNIGWLQTPLTDEQVKKLNAKSTRKMSIKGKMIIALTLSCLTTTIAITYMSRMLFLSYMKAEYKDQALGISRLIANALEADDIDDYLKYGKTTYGYDKTEALLRDISRSTPTIIHLYVHQAVENGYLVIFDFNTNENTYISPGTHIHFKDKDRPYLEKLKAGKEFSPVIFKDPVNGMYISSITPVFNSRGEYVCYTGVDLSMADLYQVETQFMVRLISLCIGFMLMIICAGMWFAKYHVIYPVNALEKAAKSFDYSDADSRKKNVDNIRELSIHTGDEIENLYFTLLQTLEETMVNYSTMRQNARDLDMVQSGLIMVLADMVENRDSSTGDHIRKTATYTGIVMHKMREMGFYTEELTDEFVSNVVKSAPLHDIGKIHISDSILNKPGKLTDEEFEIMKLHTVFGAKVIDQCLITLPRTRYLIEAKNIAKYHHEKWNGKGYPKGLSGEEIPLSARIMAVADVFDALVSSRVYKDAFPFEKAMDIIKKDSGSHFDPKVAEAFIAASDEVKAASEHFDKNKLNNYIKMSE